MAGIGDLFKGNIVTTIAIGVGAVILVPVVARASKPLMKAAIKGGIIAFEKGKEALSEVGEVMEDLVAEVKAEMAEVAEEAEEVVIPAKAKAKAPARKAAKVAHA